MTYTERSTDEDDAAIATARDTFATWRRASGLFRERRDDQLLFMAMELVKRIAESHDEIELWASIIKSYADHAEQLLHRRRIQSLAGDATLPSEPRGVVFGSRPWIFRSYQLIRFTAQNLVAGNVIPLRHSPRVQQCAEASEELFQNPAFTQEIVAGHHQLSAEESASSGGTDNELDPFGQLLAGLGNSTSMMVAMNARRGQWSLEGVVVRLRYCKVQPQASAGDETLVELIDRVECDQELAGKLNEVQRRFLDMA